MKQRVLTGVLAGAGFLAMLAIGGYPFHVLLMVMAVIGFDELVRMSQSSRTDFPAIAGYAGILLMMWPMQGGAYLLAGDAADWLWLWMLLIMAGMVLGKNRTSIDRAAALLFGVLYIGTGFHFMAVSRWSDDGLFITFLLFVCIWLTDAGAYFVGSRFGRRKLIPAISPNKTVEGALGGLLFAIVGALLFPVLLPESLTWGQALLLGVTVGGLAQIGDLIQSAYKRFYGVKDSGRLLPGHGGILDRCDSWLIVFPFIWLFLDFFA